MHVRQQLGGCMLLCMLSLTHCMQAPQQQPAVIVVVAIDGGDGGARGQGYVVRHRWAGSRDQVLAARPRPDACECASTSTPLAAVDGGRTRSITSGTCSLLAHSNSCLFFLILILVLVFSPVCCCCTCTCTCTRSCSYLPRQCCRCGYPVPAQVPPTSTSTSTNTRPLSASYRRAPSPPAHPRHVAPLPHRRAVRGARARLLP